MRVPLFYTASIVQIVAPKILVHFSKKCYSTGMLRFIKNNLHALLHFCSPSGRDSRQAFCDIYKGSILLALIGVFICMWRNTLAILYLREWLVLSDVACWIVVIVFELLIVLSFVCATIRRWQDLDIRMPHNESVRALIVRPRFWEVLATMEGSVEANHYGPAPKDNPTPLLDATDIREDVEKQLFVNLGGIEQIK